MQQGVFLSVGPTNRVPVGGWVPLSIDIRRLILTSSLRLSGKP